MYIPPGYQALADNLSDDRLAPYLAAQGGNHSAAVRLYTWKVEVSSAFWGELHAVEIAVRNAMQRELSKHFQRSDWWNHQRVTFHHIGEDQMDKAIRDADKTAGRKGRGA